RARSLNERTLICDCTAVIVFAAFFIEANLNHIIESSKKSAEMKRFLNVRYPGLQDKLGWFYNNFVARLKATNRRDMYDFGIEGKLRKKFPGFEKIYEFRNSISHGVIDRNLANLQDAESLRLQAKMIVDELFRISARSGFSISRSITYEVAINSTD
ncbi:MAG: hypothetical protein Q7T18_09755, partial [Sedimentisphaerales bacterium]|nr:hypothetical protein [Sedimentisphaerales bacterium]